MYSKLLINEPPLQVLPSLAKLIGLNEAIVLQQLHYLMRHSEHIHEGRKWVCKTYDDWQGEVFSFWSIITIRRTFTYLENLYLVRSTSSFNKLSIDRSKWYSIDYEKLDEFVQKKMRTHEALLNGNYRAQVCEITPSDQFDHMVGSYRSDGRINLIGCNKEKKELSTKKKTTTKKGVVVSPETEETKEDKTETGMDPDKPDITEIINRLDNSPLKGLIPSGALRKAIEAYVSESHQEHQPESPHDGITRLIDWMIAIAKDPQYPSFTNPPGFLLALSRRGMDKPAAVARQESEKNATTGEGTTNSTENRIAAACHNVLNDLCKAYPNVEVQAELSSIPNCEGLLTGSSLPSPEQMQVIHAGFAEAQERADEAARVAFVKIRDFYTPSSTFSIKKHINHCKDI